MTYDDFCKQVADKGFLVTITQFGTVQVKNKQDTLLANVFGTKVYDFDTWIAAFPEDFGGEEKRLWLVKKVIELAATKISDRRSYPAKFLKQDELQKASDLNER